MDEVRITKRSPAESILVQASLAQVLWEFPSEWCKVELDNDGQEDIDDKKWKLEGFCKRMGQKGVKVAPDLERELVVGEEFKPKKGVEFSLADKNRLAKERSKVSTRKTRVLNRAVTYGYIHSTASEWTQKTGDNDIEAVHRKLKIEAYERYKTCAEVVRAIPSNESVFYQLPPMLLLIMICIDKFKKIQQEDFIIKREHIEEVVKQVFEGCNLSLSSREEKAILEIYFNFIITYEDSYTEESLEKYYLFARSMGDKVLENGGKSITIDSHEARRTRDNHKGKTKSVSGGKEGTPSKKKTPKRKLPPSIAKRGPKEKWVAALKTELDDDEFQDMFHNMLLGTEMNVYNIQECFDKSLSAHILLILSTMHFAQVRDVSGVAELADKSLDTMTGLFENLKRALGIEDDDDSSVPRDSHTGKWVDNNLIWKDDEDPKPDAGAYIYRVPAMEGFVIGSMKGIQDMTKCIDEKYSEYEESLKRQLEYFESARNEAIENQGAKFDEALYEDPERKKTKIGWTEFACALFRDITTYVALDCKTVPAHLRMPEFTRKVQEFHNNWASQGKMDFLKNGIFGMGKRKGRGKKRKRKGKLPRNKKRTSKSRKTAYNSTKLTDSEIEDEAIQQEYENQMDARDDEQGNSEQDGQDGREDESDNHEIHESNLQSSHQENSRVREEWEVKLDEWKKWRGAEQGEHIMCGIDLRSERGHECYLWKERILEKNGAKCYNCGLKIHRVCSMGTSDEPPYLCRQECKEEYEQKMSSRGLPSDSHRRDPTRATEKNAEGSGHEANRKATDDNNENGGKGADAGSESHVEENKAEANTGEKEKGGEGYAVWMKWCAGEATICGLHNDDKEKTLCKCGWNKMIPEGGGKACCKCGCKMHDLCVHGSQEETYEAIPPYFCSEGCKKGFKEPTTPTLEGSDIRRDSHKDGKKDEEDTESEDSEAEIRKEWRAVEERTHCGLYSEKKAKNQCVAKYEIIPINQGRACIYCGRKMHIVCAFKIEGKRAYCSRKCKSEYSEGN